MSAPHRSIMQLAGGHGHGPRRFEIHLQDGSRLGPFPSYDIACLAVEQQRMAQAAADARDSQAERYRQRLSHARAWFGARVRRWLEAGMPAHDTPMPPCTSLEAVEPRILARNGPALAGYLADPGQTEHRLYDLIAARYLRAAFGAVVAPATVRVALEPMHRSLALRQMARDSAVQVHVKEVAARYCLRLEAETAAERLRDYAGFYRGLDRRWLAHVVSEAGRARWQRLCRRSVLLPGLDMGSLFEQARTLLQAAGINHGVDTGEQDLCLRRALLHLSQWRLATRLGLI